MSSRFELCAGRDAAHGIIVTSLRGVEEISRPFSFRVTFRSPATDLESELLGADARLTIRGAGGARTVAGIVASIRMLRPLASSEGAIYRARIAPRLWTLGLSRNSRIFQEMTVPDIVDAVLAEHGIDRSFRTVREYPARAYCVQYEESDLAFISRIAAEEGIFFHLGAHAEGGELPREIVVFADDPSGYDPIAGATALRYRERDGMARPGEHVESFAMRRRVRPAAARLTGFDFRRPTTRLTAEAGAASQPRVYEHGMDFSTWGVSEEAARVHLEQHRAGHVVGEGDSRCVRLLPGAWFSLEDHPRSDLDRRFAAIRVEHWGHVPEAGDESEDVYRNRFLCVPADVSARPARPRPRIRQIVETATVVGPPGEEIHTDEHGRVKVWFHWDRQGAGDDRSSTWIRVLQPWAGSAWGAQFIPRVGMEVVVTFPYPFLRDKLGDPQRRAEIQDALSEALGLACRTCQ